MSQVIDCPCCGNTGSAGTRPIAGCTVCGHAWTPNSADQQRALEAAIYVRDYPGYKRDAALDAHFDELIAASLRPMLPAEGQVLDVGCGGGAFLDAAQRAGLDARGLDISPEAAQLCRERGLKAEAGDFLTFGIAGEFAAITFWDVLEHLRDPRAFLTHAATLLKPGGVLVAKVPIFGALSVALSARSAQASRVLLGTPDHVQFYTPHSLEQLFTRSGFTAQIDRMPPGGMRTPPSGGGLVKHIARSGRGVIAHVSGDGNVMVLARIAGH